MLEGKVGQATRLIDNENQTGPLKVNSETIKLSKEKHLPATKRDSPELNPTIPVEPVIYESIDASAAKNTFGSKGPCLIDANGWKHMLDVLRALEKLVKT
jgi:hypothetical protein